MNAFTQFLKELRTRRQLPLRRFCEMYSQDPSNYSKMERGLRMPPKTLEAQKNLARQLEIAEGSDEWRRFLDAAATSAGMIPQDLLDDQELAGKLPVLFRTLRGEKLTDEQLEEVVELIRSANRAESTDHAGSDPLDAG